MNERHTAGTSRLERLLHYPVTLKTTAFLMIATAIGVMYIGSGTGAWMPNERAEQMAHERAEAARTELAGAWCVEQFLSGPDAVARLTELQGIESRYRRTQFVEGGDWAVQPGDNRATRSVASSCADVLLEQDPATVETAVDETRATEEL